MNTSGTYSFNPTVSDIVLEGFERCGIRASEITPDHLFSARRSINLLQSTWNIFGVNLWAVDQIAVPLVQGLATYSVPSNTIQILDTYIRTYPMGAPVNLTPTFTTTSTSTTINVYQSNHGLSVGNYINVIVPVSVGGVVLLAYYIIQSVVDSNNYTITAASAATSSTTGGVVPTFTSGTSSTVIAVNLPNHGYLSGANFVIQVSTALGGITLFGNYTITSVIDVNNFTIAALTPAASSQVVSENSGQAQIAGQQVSAQLVDRVMGPMSRTDYNSLPNKMQTGFPTIYWFDRLINPTITLWEVPDGNGPYQLYYYRMRQIQDSNPVNGQTAEVPIRFLEPLCAGLAFHLSMKWAADKSVALKTYYDSIFKLVIDDDREIVPMRIAPILGGYYRG